MAYVRTVRTASGATAVQIVHSSRRGSRDIRPGWCKQAAVDEGRLPGTTTADAKKIKELEREVKEPRRANEILLAALSFFARELDPRLPW